jgi:hypothetical protein
MSFSLNAKPIWEGNMLYIVNNERHARLNANPFLGGDGVVDQLAAFLAKTQPGLWGVTRANLFRMRQFHDTYVADKKVTPLVRQLHPGPERAAGDREPRAQGLI